MLFDIQTVPDFALFELRRTDLISRIKEKFPEASGLVVLIGGFESERYRFQQESSFYYFTGIIEPAVVLTIDLDTHTVLYVPACETNRAQWVHAEVELTQENAQKLKIQEVKELGNACAGYQVHPFFTLPTYQRVVDELKNRIQKGDQIFTLTPETPYGYIEQRFVINRLKEQVPGLSERCVDISSIVAAMRCKKDMREIELLNKAIDVTMMSHEAAAQSVEPGIYEAEVQASLEYVMTAAQCEQAFPSIVAGGKRGTVLHYTQNNDVLSKDELVVVDIGARYEYYCADVTRTYPVSGKFTKRQREVYDIVLACQEHVASHAKPGVWLNNKEKPQESLHHIAVAFMKKHGYEKYFPHGIGHFLGLDVHDVGDVSKPLEDGNVITIEPGIYIPQEGIGIRIEDNYWITGDGVICMSEQLPKKAVEIEQFMQDAKSAFEQEDSFNDLDDDGSDEIN